MSMNFKSGDYVRLDDDTNISYRTRHLMERGNIYKVEYVRFDGEEAYLHLEGVPDPIGFFAMRFTLVSPPQPDTIPVPRALLEEFAATRHKDGHVLPHVSGWDAREVICELLAYVEPFLIPEDIRAARDKLTAAGWTVVPPQSQAKEA